MTKSESISLRVTPSVKQAVEKAARSQQQTTAALVEIVIVEWLNKEGFLRQEPDQARSA
jgi:hypothetical protein